MTVTKISAYGTRGLEKVQFVAKPDRLDRYVLNKKRPASSAHPTNKAVNKVYVDSLDEAAELLRTGDYLINLVAPDGSRALRQLSKVRIA